jgi:23S rRNA pseudouridine1911/1915/1917 synthase
LLEAGIVSPFLWRCHLALGATVLPPLDILYEDNHCLALAKAAGVLSTHFQGAEETLDRAAKAYLKEKYHKPGNVFLGVVHRLDRPVSGVLLFARTSKAAARLAEQFRTGKVHKTYDAVVEGDAGRGPITLEDWLRKDAVRGLVEVVGSSVAGARHASLIFRRKGGDAARAWLEVQPRTGRTHQIRVQLAHHGHPVCGDLRYGARRTFARGAIALHARSLRFLHPVRAEPITLTAPLPESWRRAFPFLEQEVLP